MSDARSRLTEALAERYRIDRELGAGGMATVYLAHDVRHNRKVAVKVLRPELAETVGSERFLREIEIAAALHHPHILPLYDSGEADGFLFYVMPYVEGESLRDRLAREGELPVHDAVKILREVADALAKAHSQGVVHRDIKPDNVLLADRHAVVADFGVAKAVSEATGRHGITTAGVALGTPSYMAPEQASADPHVDHRADIYAFGVLAYEMLTGQPPFTGTSAQQVLAAHVTEVARPIGERRAAIPEPLADLVMRCLEKKPADRWQRADEIATRLETILTPSGGMAPTTATAAATATRPGRAVIAAGGIAILGVVVAAIWLMGGRSGAAVTLDPNVVAVLPFRVSGTGDDLPNLREGMVDLIATYLTGEGGTVRSVDPGTVIGAWREQVGDESGDLSEDEAEALAGSLGAGRVLVGSVIGSDTRLVLRGTMTSLVGEDAPIQASVEGPADSLLGLLPRFAGQLLEQSAGLVEGRDAALTTNSLPALRAYLKGQAEYRRGRFALAVTLFAEALEADSNFALAGVGLISANGWAGSATTESVTLAQRAAWENRGALTARDRAVVLAVLGPNGPGPDNGLATLEAREHAVQAAGDRAETWYYLGDAYYHDGKLLGVSDPFGRADEAFRRAIGRDSLQAGVLNHLLMLAARRGDTADLRRWAQLERRAQEDPVASVYADWFVAAVLKDTAAVGAALTMIDTGAVEQDRLPGTAFVVPFLGAGALALPEYLAHAERRAVGRTVRDRLALMGAFVNLDLGRPQAAADAFRRLSRPSDATVVLATLFWGGDSDMGARAAARLGTGTDLSSDPDYVFETTAADACVRALWQVMHEEPVDVADAARRLRADVADRDPEWPPTPNQVCADVLEAVAAQRAGAANARELIDAVDRTLVTRPYRELNWENLVVAKLLEAEGDVARAAEAAGRHVLHWGYVPFYATHLRESGRLSELAGDREAAIEAYSRYLDLRQAPEPEVQAEVDEVRGALRRLLGEG